MIGIGISVDWPYGGAQSEIPSLLSALQARATYYENVTCTTATLTSLENCK